MRATSIDDLRVFCSQSCCVLRQFAEKILSISIFVLRVFFFVAFGAENHAKYIFDSSFDCINPPRTAQITQCAQIIHME